VLESTPPPAAELYPAGPSQVPPDLTRPSPAYRRRACLAVVGLIGFLALYFGLAGWLGWTAVRLFMKLEAEARLPHWEARPERAFFSAAGGVAAAFLAIFMLKAVSFVRRGRPAGDLELQPGEHPRLFAFLHRLADEAKAPRPHRVFLSPQVNAAVFYDLSITNLVFSSKKNLVIGLGLVNALTLGELKAVIAHEFGHFAQRSMAVGRWAHVIQQIAGQIIVRRDALDRFLMRLSYSDPRIAWVGWTLRIIIWSIRSLADTVFGWVVLAQRALSREMELQADRVAVSLTGSDALVHALHRLVAADDVFDRTLAFAAAELQDGRAVADLFTVQARLLECKRAILGDPSFGVVPPLPAAPASHRLFRAKLAHPPRMWSTHPSNEVREEHAKRHYVEAPLDDRCPWLLFDDPAAVRARVTRLVYERVEQAEQAEQGKQAGEAAKPMPEPAPIERTLAEVDTYFARRYFDPAYRGVYLGRSVTRRAARASELYGPLPAPADVPRALLALYPESLAGELTRLRELEEERDMLEALQRGILEAPGGTVSYRGEERRRRAVPELIAQTAAELEAVRTALADHDRRVRAAHLAAARLLPAGWEEGLRGLLSIVHYAEHRAADLEDARGVLANVFAVITADQKVTQREVERLVAAAHVLHGVLRGIFDQAHEVALDPVLARKLGIASWSEHLGPFKLIPPHPTNIEEWMGAIDSWVGGVCSALRGLTTAALDELLRVEEEVARLVRDGGAPAASAPAASAPAAAAPAAAATPPPAPRVPRRYDAFLVEQARPRQTRLGWWDRFQVADGWGPGTLRFAAAGGLIGLVVLLVTRV
jgi:Zn-dependent protease with chaperone function